MTRKAAVLGSGYLAGLLLASFAALWLSFVGGGLLLCFGIVMLAVVRPEKSGRLFAFSAAAVSCGVGMLLYSGYDAFVCRDIVSRSGSQFIGSAVIKDVTVYSEESAFCTACIYFPDGRKADIGWYADTSEPVRGDTAVLSGTFYAPENTGFWNTADYYRSKNIFLLLDADSQEYTIKERSIFRALRNFRENAVSVIRRYVSSDEGELIIGMTLGNSEWDISQQAENSLYRSGVGHVASVSGMHMAVAAGIASAISAALSLSKRGKLGFITIVCLLFALTADLGVSVLRAFIMTIIVYSGELFRRQNDPLSSLCLAAFILTCTTPFAVRDTSFMLSFSGVFGAAVIAPAVSESIRSAYKKRFEKNMGCVGLVSSTVTAVCASLAVLPASALCLDELSVAAPVSNLLLSPFFTAAMIISMIGTVLTVLPFYWLSGGIFLAGGLVCKFLLWAADIIGSLPFAVIPSGLDVTAPMILLVMISAGVSLLVMKNRSAVILTVSAAVLICTVSISAYRAVPYEYTRIALLTNGRGGVLIINDDGYTEIFDFSGSKSGVRAAVRYAKRYDMENVGAVYLTSKQGFCAPLYSTAFPDATIISSDENVGLTYAPKGNIIKFGGISCTPYDGYFTVNAGGADIICITQKCTLSEKSFDMCIYSTSAEADVNADITAFAKKNGAKVSADTVTVTGGGEFVAMDGKIYVAEDRKWLR